ncbi:MAG: hypothetical protein ABJG42_24695 [Vibrio splendidus]
MAKTFDFTGADGDSLPNAFTVINGVFEIESNRAVNTNIIYDNAGDGPTDPAVATIQGAADDTVAMIINGGGVQTKTSGIYFRIQDEDNTWGAGINAATGELIIIQLVSGSTNIKGTSYTIPSYSASSDYLISASFSGRDISVSLDGVERITYTHTSDYLITESTHGIRFSNTGVQADNFTVESLDGSGAVDPDPVEPLPTEIRFTQSGMGRKLTKIGKLFRRPSTMSFREEYWTRCYSTDDFTDWPSSEYPVIMYSSTDHDTGTGGIWARVYEKALGEIWEGDAWHEWDDVSGRPEFNHISKKTNPIFVARLAQTETPQLVKAGGVLRLYYHENSSNGEQQGNPQSGFYASGTNGIDFSTAVLVDYSYPQGLLTGEGHTGYGEIGENKFENINEEFIGTALQGGGTEAYNNGQQIFVGDDGITWDRIAYWRRINVDLIDFNDSSESDFVYPLDVIRDARKEGDYYRIIAKYRPRTSGGDEAGTRPCEILVDENFNAVSAPNFYFELGATGEFDESEAITPDEFTYQGKVFCFYKTVESDNYSSIGIAEVTDVPKEWGILYSYSNKQTPFSAVTDTGAAAGVSYSQATTVKEEVGRQLTSLTLPQDQTVSTAVTTQSITLNSNDIVKVLFERIGKDNSEPLRMEFGVTDNLSSPTQRASLVFNARTVADDVAPSEKIAFETLGATVEIDDLVDQYVGQSSEYNSGSEESPFAKHDLGLRFISSQNKVSVMSGVTPIATFDVSGFDYSAPMLAYIKANFADTEQTADGSVSFHSIRYEAFGADEVAMPIAPTSSATTSGDTVTVTSGAVAGADSYKYYLDGVESSNGIYEGLYSGTEYTYYTRAVVSGSDSGPSTVGIITTESEEQPNQPPTANAGTMQTVAAGVKVNLNGVGSTAGVSYNWYQVSGFPVNLKNSNTATPSFTSPISSEAGDVVIGLIVTLDGLDSPVDTVTISYEAFAGTTKIPNALSSNINAKLIK